LWRTRPTSASRRTLSPEKSRRKWRLFNTASSKKIFIANRMVDLVYDASFPRIPATDPDVDQDPEYVPPPTESDEIFEDGAEGTEDVQSSDAASDEEDIDEGDEIDPNAVPQPDVAIPVIALKEASQRFPPFWRLKRQLAYVLDFTKILLIRLFYFFRLHFLVILMPMRAATSLKTTRHLPRRRPSCPTAPPRTRATTRTTARKRRSRSARRKPPFWRQRSTRICLRSWRTSPSSTLQTRKKKRTSRRRRRSSSSRRPSASSRPSSRNICFFLPSADSKAVCQRPWNHFLTPLPTLPTGLY
jgi:hypothetical protein